MELSRDYKSFLYSYNFADGLRITAGVALPSIILNYAGLLPAGILASLGALCISITDNPGPVHHRRNGMFVCLIINFLVTMITGLSLGSPLFTGLIIAVCCFIFSMAGVYGSRANAIGVSALIIMVINLNPRELGMHALFNALWILAGGTWYLLLSLAIQAIKPYRLTQQALGDLITATADYLRIRADFYNTPLEYQATYQRMMDMQAALLQKQNLVRELIFKTRKVTRESTVEGKTLLLIYLDITELFERLSASFQDYRILHQAFPGSELFSKTRPAILWLANELDEIGVAVLSGNASQKNANLETIIKDASSFFNHYRKENLNATNQAGFTSFQHILESLNDILSRLHTLHLYTRYDKKKIRQFKIRSDYDAALPRQKYDPQILKDSFTLKSNTFRHALRVSIATLAGYGISFFFPIGHSYWILLTIIVILKPAYSLTRKRNMDRLFGTITGVFLGILILYFVQDKTALFIIMLFLMIGTYSLLKTKYMYSVILMTPYILVLFHLMNMQDFRTVLTDRVVDTAIGSVIAFIANLVLFPSWSHRFFKKYIKDYLAKSLAYFNLCASAFHQQIISEKIMQRNRKENFIALANLSDAYTQILAEPKNRKVEINKYQDLVVLCHMLSSHIATLSYFSKTLQVSFTTNEMNNIIDATKKALQMSIEIFSSIDIQDKNENFHLQQKKPATFQTAPHSIEAGHKNIHDENRTFKKSAPVYEQFHLIEKISGDIYKICKQVA